MEGLDFSKIPMDLIINILNILILFVIVRTLAYKPVKKFLDERKAALAEAKETAEAKEQKAERMIVEYEAKLADIDSARRATLKIAEGEARQKAEEIVAVSKKEAEKILSDARLAIAAKEAESIERIRENVIELSLAISEKVIAKNLDDEDNRRLAERFFEKEAENIN